MFTAKQLQCTPNDVTPDCMRTTQPHDVINMTCVATYRGNKEVATEWRQLGSAGVIHDVITTRVEPNSRVVSTALLPVEGLGGEEQFVFRVITPLDKSTAEVEGLSWTSQPVKRLSEYRSFG